MGRAWTGLARVPLPLNKLWFDSKTLAKMLLSSTCQSRGRLIPCQSSGPIRIINNGEPGMINEDMRAIIEAQHLCFAATVSPDGRPNLSR